MKNVFLQCERFLVQRCHYHFYRYSDCKFVQNLFIAFDSLIEINYLIRLEHVSQFSGFVQSLHSVESL